MRDEVIEAVNRDCAFTYEEGTYRSSGGGSFSAGTEERDLAWAGLVDRTTRTRGDDGQVRLTSYSRVSGPGDPQRLGAPFGGVDFVGWIGGLLSMLTEVQATSTYVGESSFRGEPTLRYEVRVALEGAAGSVAILSVYEFVLDNPFVRIESEYLVFDDQAPLLLSQDVMSEFAVGQCPGDRPDEARLELERAAARTYTSILERIDAADCNLVFQQKFFFREGLRREGELFPFEIIRRTVFEPDGVGGWLWRNDTFDQSTGEWRTLEDLPPELSFSPSTTVEGYAARTGLMQGIEENMHPNPTDDPLYGFSFSGATEVLDRPTIRYERRRLEAREEGTVPMLMVREYVRDNPLLFSNRAYVMLPNGELRLDQEIAQTRLDTEECRPE